MDLTDLELKNLRWRYPRFFTEINTKSEFQTITGDDLKHIGVVLRMKKGDKAVLSHNLVDYFCELAEISDEKAVFKIIDSAENKAEASIYIRLFQCVPKSDKLEFITQKVTELGVMEIIPVFSERCISKPDDKSQAKKILRLKKISEEAAKQSGRGNIPIIHSFTMFSDAINKYNVKNQGIIFYECGGERLNKIIGSKTFGKIDIFIGSEGGFTEREVNLALKKGITAATLGNRILRVETAPVSAVTILMNLTENM